eukprot:12706901-Ditylum_brightwellii.AAC.1
MNQSLRQSFWKCSSFVESRSYQLWLKPMCKLGHRKSTPDASGNIPGYQIPRATLEKGSG